MTWPGDIARCRREVSAIEAQILAGNRDTIGLCLALSDWCMELRILQEEQRRQAEARLRETGGMERGQALTE